MKLVDRYIFRQALLAFTVTLITLTTTIWITQALSKFDLIVAKGQTLGIFLVITVLILPMFISVLAPVSFFLATVYTLNRLNGDSELVVLNAAGASRWVIIKPFLALSILVAIGGALVNHWLMPDSLYLLREKVMQVRTDIVTNIMQPGRFTVPEQGVTMHIRQRDPDGTLRGLLLQDERAGAKAAVTYLAERANITASAGATFLLMREGTIQRRRGEPENTQIVRFDSYAVNLSMLEGKNDQAIFEPRERRTSYLLHPDEKDLIYSISPGRFRSELHERLAGPLYPIVFVFIGLATVGFARTTRQGRGLALVTGGALALAARLAGFGASNLAGTSTGAVYMVYLIPLSVIAVCAAIAAGFLRIDGFKAAASERIFDIIGWLAALRRRPLTG